MPFWYILYPLSCSSFICQSYNVAVNKSLINHVGTTFLSIIVCFMWNFIVRKIIMLKVISLAVLFLIRIRFPVDKSIAYILRSMYGNTLIIEVRKFENINYKLQKCKLGVAFFEASLENKIIPNFLNFCVSDLHLRTSRAYHSCQFKLLREEIPVKKSKVKTFEKDFYMLKRKLREILRIIAYSMHFVCF